MKPRKIDPVRYWPRYEDDNKHTAFPKGFVLGCFIALFLWIGIAYYFKY